MAETLQPPTTNTNDNTKTYLIIGGGIILILGLAIFIYTLNFGDREKFQISDSTQDWGAFTDYLNFFVGLINVILLIAITFEVRRLDKNREDDREAYETIKESERKTLENERLDRSLRIHSRMLIAQMRTEESKRIINIFDTVESVEITNKNFYDPIIQRLNRMGYELHRFVNKTDYLFEELLGREDFMTNINILNRSIIDIRNHYLDIIPIHEELDLRNKDLQEIYQTIRQYRQEGVSSVALMQQRDEMQKIRKEILLELRTKNQVVQGYDQTFTSSKDKFISDLNRYIMAELKRID